MKLTETQAKVYKKIQDYISLAKECKTFEEYYIREHTESSKNHKDYEEVLNYYQAMFNKYKEEFTKNYEKYYLEAREKNIALTSCSSSTLRALEKKGLIKIIEDGGKYIDKVQLI